MTIKDMKYKLQEFCDARERCSDCPLEFFTDECEFNYFSKEDVEKAYNLIFIDEERGCCEDCKHCDKSMECYPCKECKNNYGIKNCFEPIYSNDKVPLTQ